MLEPLKRNQSDKQPNSLEKQPIIYMEIFVASNFHGAKM